MAAGGMGGGWGGAAQAAAASWPVGRGQARRVGEEAKEGRDMSSPLSNEAGLYTGTMRVEGGWVRAPALWKEAASPVSTQRGWVGTPPLPYSLSSASFSPLPSASPPGGRARSLKWFLSPHACPPLARRHVNGGPLAHRILEAGILITA